MIVGLAIAAAIIAGFDWRIVIAATAVALEPLALVALVVVLGGVAIHRALRRRSVDPASEVAFFAALAAELRAGASLRVALVEAAGRTPDIELTRLLRLARAGAPLEDAIPLVTTAFPTNGRIAAPAFALAGVTGARTASLFETLAERAAHAGEVRRERRGLTAQAKLSALVVGVAPLLVAVVILAAGPGALLFDRGLAGYMILSVGFGLELLGLGIVGAMLRGAR